MLEQQNSVATKAFVKSSIARLLRGEVTFDELTFTAALCLQHDRWAHRFAIESLQVYGL